MKSRKNPERIDLPEVDSIPDDSAASLPDSGETLPQPVRVGSGFDATLLMSLGIAAVAVGLALSLGPKVSWKLTQISDGFKYLGIQGGVLVMGGLILTGLGMLRRGQIALRTPTPEQLEDRLMLEQLTKDNLRMSEEIARLEGGLAHAEAEIAQSRRALEERVQACAREVIAAIPVPREEPSAGDAIYRLAASLDQVGMRIEQRLKTQYTALQDHLEDVGAAILSARNQMQGLQRGHSDDTLQREVRAQVANALEETGFYGHNGREGRPGSLGVLDSIDENPVPEASLDDVGAALPQVDPANANGTAAESGYAEGEFGDPEVDTKTRLMQLSTLLADPKLRAALEGMGGKPV